jgi:hypothetical protein
MKSASLIFLLGLFGFLLSGSSNGFASDTLCNNPFAQSPEECSAVETWGKSKFTNFSRENDKSQLKRYRYLYNELAWLTWEKKITQDQWPYKLLQNPFRIANNPKISASLIDQEKHTTIEPHVGLVLQVPPENIVGMADHDMGSDGIGDDKSLETLIEKSKSSYWAIQSPDALLKASNPKKYNEVVFQGTSHVTGRTVLPVAVVIQCNRFQMKKLNSYSDWYFSKIVGIWCFGRENSSLVPLLLGLKKKGFPIYGLDMNP